MDRFHDEVGGDTISSQDDEVNKRVVERSHVKRATDRRRKIIGRSKTRRQEEGAWAGKQERLYNERISKSLLYTGKNLKRLSEINRRTWDRRTFEPLAVLFSRLDTGRNEILPKG